MQSKISVDSVTGDSFGNKITYKITNTVPNKTKQVNIPKDTYSQKK